MIVLEFKLKGKSPQFAAVDAAIRTTQFIRNKSIRYWMDNEGVGRKELMRHNTALRGEFDWCKALNAHACQAAVDRAWFSISRFYTNCKNNSKKKGYPKFKKNVRSVEYKTSGWNLSEDRKHITFSDGNSIGRLKLIGTRDLFFYQLDQIKRVKIVRRADGYYAQFSVAVEVAQPLPPIGQSIGLDLGLKWFVATSESEVVECPKFYRRSEQQLSRSNRKKSVKFRKGQKQSANYIKARKRYARKHLRVSRQREEWVKRLAYCVIQSNDLIAYEDLNVKGLVRNHHLSKSISDAAWSRFRYWLEYFAIKYGRRVEAVAPQFTSQDCSNCGHRLKKSLSTRTHACTACGYVQDRDVNAAINILNKVPGGTRKLCTLREIRPLACLAQA